MPDLEPATRADKSQPAGSSSRHERDLAICLRITAQRGGGLLGDLLCGISQLLERGVPLSQILGGLTPQQSTRLTTGLRDLLNGVLNNLNQATVTRVQ